MLTFWLTAIPTAVFVFAIGFVMLVAIRTWPSPKKSRNHNKAVAPRASVSDRESCTELHTLFRDTTARNKAAANKLLEL